MDEGRGMLCFVVRGFNEVICYVECRVCTVLQCLDHGMGGHSAAIEALCYLLSKLVLCLFNCVSNEMSLSVMVNTPL